MCVYVYNDFTKLINYYSIPSTSRHHTWPTAAVGVVVRRDPRVPATSVRPPLPFAVSRPTVLAPGWLLGRPSEGSPL